MALFGALRSGLLAVMPPAGTVLVLTIKRGRKRSEREQLNGVLGGVYSGGFLFRDDRGPTQFFSWTDLFDGSVTVIDPAGLSRRARQAIEASRFRESMLPPLQGRILDESTEGGVWP